MNCSQIHKLLAAYALGELDLGLHRKVDQHLEECPSCLAQLKAMERDVLRISTLLSAELLPPSGLLEGMAPRLPERKQRPTISWRPLVLSFVAACALLFVLFQFRAHPMRYQALALADVPLPSSLMSQSEGNVAQLLSQSTGLLVTPVSAGIFEGGGCVLCNGNEVPVLLYRRDGARIAVYEVPAGSLGVSGMHPMEVMGQPFFCCSRGSGALVAVTRGAKTYLISGNVDEKSLAMAAMKFLS